jgi:Flp pilus assembly protein TadG
MKSSHKGQTVIETALMIILLFVLFFAIAEIARFWWLKNMINNAARVGVRVAIVDTTLTSAIGSPASPQQIATCSYNAGTGNCSAISTSGSGITTTAIQDAACSSLTNGVVCANATVYLTVQEDPDNPGQVIPGGIVTVKVISPPIGTIVPGLAGFSLGLIPVDSSGNIALTADSTMRHE